MVWEDEIGIANVEGRNGRTHLRCTQPHNHHGHFPAFPLAIQYDGRIASFSSPMSCTQDFSAIHIAAEIFRTRCRWTCWPHCALLQFLAFLTCFERNMSKGKISEKTKYSGSVIGRGGTHTRCRQPHNHHRTLSNAYTTSSKCRAWVVPWGSPGCRAPDPVFFLFAENLSTSERHLYIDCIQGLPNYIRSHTPCSVWWKNGHAHNPILYRRWALGSEQWTSRKNEHHRSTPSVDDGRRREFSTHRYVAEVQ